MALIRITPKNTGGGRASGTPSAKLYDGGQLTLNASAAKLLGNAQRVLIDVDNAIPLIVLTPTTPGNAGGAFSVNGGGYMPIRLTIREAVTNFPHLIGDYICVKRAGAVELRRSVSEG